jgi:uncharacterized membrane protein YciS (DUF1049 family)
MRTLLYIGVVVLVVAFAILLVVNNMQEVSLNLPLVQPVTVALWRVLLGSFLIGAVLVGAGMSWPYLRLRLRARTQARQIARLEQEVHGLRTLPLPDEESGASEG